MSDFNIQTRYMFEIQSKVDATPLGDVPDGFRVDLNFDPAARVYFDPAKVKAAWPADMAWHGLDGGLVSGGDWVTVYSTGTIRLNGRATIRVGPGDDEHPLLIDMLYVGVIDLAHGDVKKGEESFSAWKRGGLRLPKGQIQFALAVNFELAVRTESWATSVYKIARAEYDKYARLGRSQYVAVGSATLAPQPFSPITDMHLAVYEACIASPVATPKRDKDSGLKSRPDHKGQSLDQS